MTVLDHLKVWSCPLKSGQAIKLGWQAYEPAVVVTGASEGIGRAFAELLTDKEFTPLLISRDAGALNSLAAELSGRRRGTRLHTLAIDITQPDAASKVEAYLHQHNLYADVLINNAGIGLGGRFDTHASADVTQLLDTNICTLVRFTHHFLPGMLGRSIGGVLNVGSLAGFMPGPWQALYFASKAFVLSFSQAIATECADRDC
jgi:uncharacterized protein